MPYVFSEHDQDGLGLQSQHSITSSATFISPQQSSTDYSEVGEGREGWEAEQQRAAHVSGRGRDVIWVNYGNGTLTRHDRGGRVEAEWKTAE